MSPDPGTARQLNVRIPTELHDRVSRIADDEDRKLGVVVRRILTAYVADPEIRAHVQAALDRAGEE